MAVETIGWEGADTDQNRESASIWGRCPWNAIVSKRVGGYHFYDNFGSFNKTAATTEGNWAAQNGYAQFSSTGGTITPAAGSATTKAGIGTPGIKILSDDDDEGVSLRTLSTPFMLNRANSKFWFEACFKVSTIAATKIDLFIGLMEDTALTAAIPITATTGTLADKNLLGMYLHSSVPTLFDTTYKADGVTAVVVGTGEGTALVADTFTKFGMKYEPVGDRAGSYALSFYQDGTRLATAKLLPDSNGTDFPTDIAMGPCLAILNAAGTSPGNATIKWWKAAQLYAPFN